MLCPCQVLGRTTARRRRLTAYAALQLPAAPEAQRSGSSRQGCASNGVQVPIPSIARFRRVAYPGHGEVTTYERLGWKSHGCHTVYAVSVGAIWVASKPVGLNMKKQQSCSQFQVYTFRDVGWL